MKKCSVVLMLSVLPFTACYINQEHYKINTAFNEKDAEKFTEKGTGSITGQLLVNDTGNSCAEGGEMVYLRVYNAYTEEIYSAMSNHFIIDNIDPRWEKYEKSTVASSNGFFEFKDIPEGNYILFAVPTWPDSFNSGQWIVGYAQLPIILRKDQKINVTLTATRYQNVRAIGWFK